MSILNARRPPLASPLRPTWAWDFARYGRVPAGATYTGSGGTFVGSNGLIQSATTNVPRFDYDPATLSPLGYLAEMASTNGLLRSGAFGNAAWTQYGASSSGSTVTAPDGTTSVTPEKEDGTNAAHGAYQTITLAADTYAGFSCFFKAGTRSAFYINLQLGAGQYATAVYDLVGATVSQTSVGATSGTIASTSIRAFGNGWYRCGMVAKVASSGPILVFGLAPAASGNTIETHGEIRYAGDNTSSGYMWGAQQDSAGVGVTSYIPTAGATASRTQDVLSLPLTSLPGWSATQGGVLVAAYRLHTLVPASPGYDQAALEINDGVDNNMVRVKGQDGGGGNAKGQIVSGGATQGSPIAGTSPAAFTRSKLAVGWSTSRLIACQDGTAAATPLSGSYSLPVSPTTLNIAKRGTHSLNGTLESIAYYRGARSDAFVQAVSR